MENKIKALAAYLGVDESTISEGYDDDILETEDGEEYLVLDEYDATERAREAVINSIEELGITSFTESFQDWVYSNALDEEWFEDAMKESYEAYVDDIENESDSTYDNRLIQEMYDEGIIDDEDFDTDEDGEIDYTIFQGDLEDAKERYVSHLCDQWDDPVQWYKDNFGDDSLNDIVSQHNLLDTDAIADEAIEWDSRGHFLADYDGDEIDLGDEFDDQYYAYRLS